jgi:hypothetical protein
VRRNVAASLAWGILLSRSHIIWREIVENQIARATRSAENPTYHTQPTSHLVANTGIVFKPAVGTLTALGAVDARRSEQAATKLQVVEPEELQFVSRPYQSREILDAQVSWPGHKGVVEVEAGGRKLSKYAPNLPIEESRVSVLGAR